MSKEMSMNNQRQSYSPPELFPLGTLRTITGFVEDVTGGFDSPATINIDIDLNNQI